jgi:hypothetical protein
MRSANEQNAAYRRGEQERSRYATGGRQSADQITHACRLIDSGRELNTKSTPRLTKSTEGDRDRVGHPTIHSLAAAVDGTQP